MSTKEEVLAALKKNRGSFLSGEDLSKKLGVSRTSIWKAIKALREQGYLIDAITNKGYTLLEDRFRITEESLRSYFPAKYRNIPLYIYDTIDSTNNRAKEILHEIPGGTGVIIAMQQTGGRGRLGRTFFSPKEGLYISIVIKPDFDLDRSMLATSATAVAVAEAIEEVSGMHTGIKWVNDIYGNGKKVCGILTEGITNFETGQIDSLIIGIGINTTTEHFPENLLPIAGAVEGEYSRSELAASVIGKTLDMTSSLDRSDFIEKYRARSIVIGKMVNVYKGQYKVSPESELPSRRGRVLDIDDDGGLIVLYSDGTRDKLLSGEISLRLT